MILSLVLMMRVQNPIDLSAYKIVGIYHPGNYTGSGDTHNLDFAYQ